MLLHGHVLVILVLIIIYSLFCIFLSSISIKPSIKESSLPIHSIFKFPSGLPPWPPGDGFANGYIDLGGLQVYQIRSLKKIWAAYEGGPNDLGATIFEPSEIPPGFFMLGSYSQPNNRPVFGSILVGKDISNATGEQEILKKPVDYVAVWTSKSTKISHTGLCYIWYPIAPDGYEAVGYVVTNSSEKPSLDRIRCVRSDFTYDCEAENWIWSETSYGDGLNMYSLTPSSRGNQDPGVQVGSFILVKKWDEDALTSLSCLKSKKMGSNFPSLRQIHALFQTYSPIINFHPQEPYLPSSVNWFFSNGALLYTKGLESSPVPIRFNGENLPQGGLDDGKYWLGLPFDHENASKEKLKKGNLQSSEAYLHVKSMFGGTFTDIVVWIFCPFNGPGMAKFGPFDISLGRIGEHVSDWEHISLRISNFDGMLQKVFFSQHSSGSWVDASLLEFQNGSNKFVAYSSLHGHAFYPKPGMVLQGKAGFGIRNDMAKSNLVLDTGNRYEIVCVDYNNNNVNPLIMKPPWLFFAGKWGPEMTYNLGLLVKMMEKVLVGVVRSAFQKMVGLFPEEIYGEASPIGPKMKRNWKKDEL